MITIKNLETGKEAELSIFTNNNQCIQEYTDCEDFGRYDENLDVYHMNNDEFEYWIEFCKNRQHMFDLLEELNHDQVVDFWEEVACCGDVNTETSKGLQYLSEKGQRK